MFLFTQLDKGFFRNCLKWMDTDVILENALNREKCFSFIGSQYQEGRNYSRICCKQSLRGTAKTDRLMDMVLEYIWRMIYWLF